MSKAAPSPSLSPLSFSCANLVRTALVLLLLSGGYGYCYGYRHGHGFRCSKACSVTRVQLRRTLAQMVGDVRDGGHVLARRELSRQVILTSAGVLASTWAARPSVSSAAFVGTVAVLGAKGRTGSLITQELASRGVPVVELTREQADVTKPESLDQALKGQSVVIFAASASKNGGSAEAVDYLGVKNVAEACVRCKVGKLVLISSGAVTKPDSIGYKVTNLFGNIMDYKVKGEDALRKVYASAEPSLHYTIIRPGGLKDGSPDGPSAVEVNQGDFIIGEISRSDVALATVAAALAGKDTDDVTFEVYGSRSRYPLQFNFPKTSGFERRGDNWSEIFAGLKTDADLSIALKK